MEGMLLVVIILIKDKSNVYSDGESSYFVVLFRQILDVGVHFYSWLAIFLYDTIINLKAIYIAFGKFFRAHISEYNNLVSRKCKILIKLCIYILFSYIPIYV